MLSRYNENSFDDNQRQRQSCDKSTTRCQPNTTNGADSSNHGGNCRKQMLLSKVHTQHTIDKSVSLGGRYTTLSASQGNALTTNATTSETIPSKTRTSHAREADFDSEDDRFLSYEMQMEQEQLPIQTKKSTKTGSESLLARIRKQALEIGLKLVQNNLKVKIPSPHGGNLLRR